MSIINRINIHLKKMFSEEDAHIKTIQILSGRTKVSTLDLSPEVEQIIEELKGKLAYQK